MRKNYELAFESGFKSGTMEAIKKNEENRKREDIQTHEIHLKEMELQAQKDLFLNIGLGITLLIILSAIISYSLISRKKKSKIQKNTVNSIKEKMELLNTLLNEGVISREEFDNQKIKLRNQYNV